jgi:hypothetical protein
MSSDPDGAGPDELLDLLACETLLGETDPFDDERPEWFGLGDSWDS